VLPKEANTVEDKTPIIDITTKSSTRVKPLLLKYEFFNLNKTNEIISIQKNYYH
jgi:hypothetical protein